jgi:hypothetical protein
MFARGYQNFEVRFEIATFSPNFEQNFERDYEGIIQRLFEYNNIFRTKIMAPFNS